VKEKIREGGGKGGIPDDLLIFSLTKSKSHTIPPMVAGIEIAALGFPVSL
jgi:hypothetical protein